MSGRPAAFLGLGAIGAPMAARLARGGALTVWNRTRSRAEEFARAHGARSAATPREAANGADVVITCLPTSREVEAVLDGPDGLLAGLARGALLLDCTSGDPAPSRSWSGPTRRPSPAPGPSSSPWEAGSSTWARWAPATPSRR